MSEQTSFNFDTVGILGVGLIGGSLGLGIRQRRLARRVIGIGRNAQRLERARVLGAVDDCSTDLCAAAGELDLLVLCTPVSMMGEVLAPARDAFKELAVITDAGSTKAGVERRVREALDGREALARRFVGSHPMAGSEKTGVEHADADLFMGATCAVTCDDQTDTDAVEAVSALWTELGAKVVRISPEEHDRLVARTSHLPHVVAAALVAAVSQADGPGLRRFIGEGFRDTTRIAAGDETMWRDICIDNAAELSSALRAFGGEIDRFVAAIESGDAATIETMFRDARTLRQSVD